MGGKPATVPAGVRLADYLSTGLVARICTPALVNAALDETGRQSKRQRDLPAHAVAYSVPPAPDWAGRSWRISPNTSYSR